MIYEPHRVGDLLEAGFTTAISRRYNVLPVHLVSLRVCSEPQQAQFVVVVFPGCAEHMVSGCHPVFGSRAGE